MRAGRRLRVGLTSYVGPATMTSPAILGQVRLGGDATVGLPAVGSRVGTASPMSGVRVG
jgi:hypothetical protein